MAEGGSGLKDRLRRGDGPHYSVDQPGKPGFELLAAQRVELGRPLHPLTDHAGLAQYAEVVRARRLRNGELEAVARPLTAVGDRPDNQQPDWVAQGVQHAGELELVLRGVRRCGRRDCPLAGRLLVDRGERRHCSTFIELAYSSIVIVPRGRPWQRSERGSGVGGPAGSTPSPRALTASRA